MATNSFVVCFALTQQLLFCVIQLTTNLFLYFFFVTKDAAGEREDAPVEKVK